MNFKHTFVRVFSDKGLLLTLALSLCVLFTFYGKLLRHPASTYFSSGGDGMQIYYQTLYHTKYDPQFWSQKSINYPYGESIFFTGAMPFVNNAVKIFGPSAAPLGVALINLLMLFSPVIGALFLYAIFRHLRLPWYYGAVCATGIAFLSPQMMRFYGHYSLAWVFLIPAMFYLLLRFYEYPSVARSFGISLLVFIGASTHLYFLAFFAALAGPYWAVLFLTRDRGFGRILFVLKHASIQFILPVVILELLMIMSDHVTDRTAAPWGYLYYHSDLYGVFFPFGKPYEDLARRFFTPDDVALEGIAYAGLAAMAGLVLITIVQLYRLLRGRFRLLLQVTDNKPINIFFWVSIVMLWISFGHPFVNGHEDWLLHLGPVRQFRSVGRFTWLFFYSMNIVAVYRFYRVMQNRNKLLRYAVVIVIPVLLYVDMYYNIKGRQDEFNNRIVELEDEQNLLPEDSWLRKFDPHAYQAILPLPYFHTGSENICRIPPSPEIIEQSYIVSLKTGLPLMGFSSARVSLSQTAKLISLVMNPITPAGVLRDLPDQRPFLLVVREDTLDENEKRLLSLAKPVAVSSKYKIYSLLPAAVAGIPQQQYLFVKARYDSLHLFTRGKFSIPDSSAWFYYQSFDDKNGKPYRGAGSYSWKITDPNCIFDSTISVAGNYTCSFWMNHINEDLYPRMTMEIYSKDDSGKVQPYYLLTDALKQIKAIDGNWGLIEFPLNVPAAGMHAHISMWNREMKKETFFEIDEFMIRPEHTDIYRTSGDTILFNNCSYHPWK